jgi:hypothetical protein
MAASNNAHEWQFFRAGGFDQVRIDRGSDLLALDTLDQKLWVALSCPTRGLEFDTRTLDLIDTDQDGHIRAPEIIAAAKWAGALLKDADVLVRREDGLSLAEIDDSTEDGRQLLASARQILNNLGKSGAQVITSADTADTSKIFDQTRFNGDGIIPANVTEDATLQCVIDEIIDCLGAKTDRNGAPGISLEKSEQFFSELRAYYDWQESADKDAAILPLGAATAAAAEALGKIRPKVDDYFTRCRLAAYDPRAAILLNRSDADYQALSAHDLSAAGLEVAAFPIATTEAAKPLPLNDGLNPAWADAIRTFRSLAVEPLLGPRANLSADEWMTLTTRFAAYDGWLSAKPSTSVEKIGLTRIREILAGDYKTAIEDLISQDKALEPEANAISSVDKLVRYCRDLSTLANNFVSFSDFYTRRAKAVFQAGTLYLDGRSCEFCIKVEDAAKHSALASLSRVCLVYCDCTRKGGGERMTVAAAFTAGDSDQLMAGRNGVFYDRKGQDWDATIVKIIEHPISIRQAFWSPYKRVGRMVGEQLQKIAASRAKTVEDKMAASALESGKKIETAKPGPQPFDVAKFAGIFAAIGLAVGAIGTALASVVTGLLNLAWWQMPLALLGLLLAISGPAMAIAWFKLRQRNLGPILDANGWAVNARAKINIPFGTALTGIAKLPIGAGLALVDPFAEKENRWPYYLALVVLLAAAFLLWRYGFLSRWLG